MMQLQPKFIIGVIVTIFACSAIVHTLRGWDNAVRETSAKAGSRPSNRLRQSARTKEEEMEDYVALDEEEEAAELYGFTSIEGEFEWNKFKAPRYIEHIHNDEQDSTFFIAPKKDVERRLHLQQRMLKTDSYDGTYVGVDSIHGGAENKGIYAAGDVGNYSYNDMSDLLHSHTNVAFTRKWKGVDHLVVTQLCSIKHITETGAYFCVDNKTVCVTVKSFPQFYGDHVMGGRCGTFPLDEETLHSLSEAFQKAYAATCDACDGTR
jgi:hypothetical protein